MMNLDAVLPKVGPGGRRDWEPNGNGVPDAQWLELLLEYLAENAAAVPVADLEHFPLIPDQFDRLHSPSYPGTPFFGPRTREA